MFRKTRLALVVSCFTSGFTVSALAQDTPSSSQGETLVVTSQTQRGATKLETPDIETPQAVSIITRDQIQEQGATSVRQAVG
ncbi:TonB-dependent siderophore receptor, partial [Pectobacterium versatile]